MSDGEWLTYQKAGEKFGLSPEAVRQRARRFKWRIQKGNDGKAQVLVPKDVAVQPRGRPAVQTGGQTAVQPADSEALSAAFGSLLDKLELRRAAEVEALKQEHGAAVVQLRQDHAAELERLGQATAQLRQDHATELERLTNAHKTEADRLTGIINQLTSRPSWWARLFGRR